MFMNRNFGVYIFMLVLTTDASFTPDGSEPHWLYPEDEKWPDTCHGKKQSPIDISDINTKKVTPPFPEIKLINYDRKVTASCLNDGHTVKITIDSQHELYVIGGGLRGKYSLQQIHFHWKSEHTVNGKRLPLEGHFVHVNKDSNRYRTKRDASVTENDDLQVLAVLYKISIENNTNLANVIETIQHVSTVGSTKNIEFIPRLLLPENIGVYYRYEGSLTTPPCYEIVKWIVFASMVPLSLDQYDTIVATEHWFGGSKNHNYRHVMPLNTRVVKFYNSGNVTAYDTEVATEHWCGGSNTHNYQVLQPVLRRVEKLYNSANVAAVNYIFLIFMMFIFISNLYIKR